MDQVLFTTLAQQYSIVTAEIISKTGRLKLLYGDEKKEYNKSIACSIQDAKELLEQMEFEVRGFPIKEREKFENQIKGHQVEFSKLEKDFVQAKYSNNHNSRVELLAYEINNSEEQQLISNNDRLEKSGEYLEQGFKTCLETEKIGAEILEDLSSQRNSILKSRERLRQTHEKVGIGSRILTSMLRKSIQNRVVLAGVAVLFLLTIIICIVIIVNKHS